MKQQILFFVKRALCIVRGGHQWKMDTLIRRDTSYYVLRCATCGVITPKRWAE